MRIIVGVSGSIAAYKITYLVRGLVKSGHEVKVVLTPDASHFVSPLTLSTLSKNPVHSDMVEGDAWANHVELGLWADLFIIAPATANTLAKMAHGLCNNMLMATYLSAKCPVWVAPAMDLDMWKHPATQKNLEIIGSFPDHRILPVGVGELASGLKGPGRMAEPEEIQEWIELWRPEAQSLDGLQVLVTAGPTREPIDPVRFISNRSTGTMGMALAKVLAERGASVNLVCGPIGIPTPNHPNIRVFHSETAAEMYHQCEELHPNCALAIWTAAVADFTPSITHEDKVKKGDSQWSIDLKKTTDIAKTLGMQKQGKVHIGFALESKSGQDEAKRKLESKNLDIIVLNSLKNKGAGFGTQTNQITIFDRDEREVNFDLKSKTEVAIDIVDHYSKHYHSS